MADGVPAALRQSDINIYKCATKAVQLQAVKPIVSYWCEYWVVNQIIARQLHSSSEEIFEYTTRLMDKLEQIKLEYADEEAVTDDVAAQAYLEQFAQETLDRAERVVRANKVTQQTAMTFDAAATFFHLVNIWGPPDQETQQKIKYAKWNAARIAKAIREGRDPNESNPKQEVPSQPALDPGDPDAALLDSYAAGTTPQPVTVEDVSDDDAVQEASVVALPQSPASSSHPGSGEELCLPGVPTQLGQPAPPQPGYFDDYPTPSPSAPPGHRSTTAQPAFPPPPRSSDAYPPPAPAFDTRASSTPAVAPVPTVASASPHPAPTARSAAVSDYSSARTVGGSTADEEAMALAQKHAKWAISALNFEDVSTAVKELRQALEALGAS